MGRVVCARYSDTTIAEMIHSTYECTYGMEKCAKDMRFCVYSSQDCPIEELTLQDVDVDKYEQKWNYPIVELRIVAESDCGQESTCLIDGHPWHVVVTPDLLKGDFLLVGRTAPEFIGDWEVMDSRDNFANFIREASRLQNNDFLNNIVEEEAKDDHSKAIIFLATQGVTLFAISLVMMTGWQFRDG